MLQGGRSRIRVTMKSLNFISLPNPSSRTMALGVRQPLTEMSTIKPVKADNLTAMGDRIVLTMWDPQERTPLKASTACYRG
jgi:hypothetical protein